MTQPTNTVICFCAHSEREREREREREMCILKLFCPFRLDLLVTETFDAALFGEHVIPALIHAWENIMNQVRMM